MRPETAYFLVNTILLPAWLSFVVAPRSRWTLRIVNSPIPAFVLALAYVGLLAIARFPDGASGASLDAAALLMGGSRWGAVACWTHFVVFDYFVGAWIVRDAYRERIHPLLLAPCTLLALFIGPAGLLLYLTLRAVRRKRFAIDDGAIVTR